MRRKALAQAAISISALMKGQVLEEKLVRWKTLAQAAVSISAIMKRYHDRDRFWRRNWQDGTSVLRLLEVFLP